MQRTKSSLAAAACAIAVAAFGAGPALAGEWTGSGKYIAGSDDAPLNGKSECAYSGLDDPDVDPVTGEDDFGRAQSWGQLPKEVRDFLSTVGAHPGDACNPSKSGGE